MEIRKLVKSGHSSLVIAIPKTWIKHNSLKAGDMIYLDDINNKLEISSESKKSHEEKIQKIIYVDGKTSKNVKHEITSAYMDNCDTIIIKGDDLPHVLDTVKNSISDLVALELVDESSNKIIAQNFLNIYDFDVKAILRRIDNIVRSMYTDTVTLKDEDVANTVFNRDNDVNRLCFLAFKVIKAAYLNRDIFVSLKLEELDILRFWQLTHLLEKIGDAVKFSAQLIAKIDDNEQNESQKLISDIQKFYVDVMTSFYKKDISRAATFSEIKRKLVHEINDFISNNGNLSGQIATNALNMVENINNINKVTRYLA